MGGTLILIIAVAAALYGYTVAGPLAGLWPFRGRVDTDGDLLWYEAESALQIAHVRHMWDRMVIALEREGRAFTVPGRRKGCTTWDDRDTWDPYLKGLAVRTHFLRIVHNHWRHDMDNDAVVIEFASAADLAVFLSRVPAEGVIPFNFADMLSSAGRAQLDTLLQANRIRTEAEAA